MRTRDLRGEQVFDSRDAIARFEELDGDRDTLVAAIEEAKEELEAHRETLDAERDEEDQTESDLLEKLADAEKALQEFDEGEVDEGEEYKALKGLIDEAKGYGDWHHGETLIRDDYFTEYAKQLAEDIGDYNSRDVKWPYTCIDWEQAAGELQQDYTSVEFDGHTYWMRS